ncbi:MAG: HD domain-containing protein [Alkalispirochaeta sp.]
MEHLHGGLGELLDRAIEFTELKDVDRTGWVLRGVDDPESVADHSWGTAQLCLLFAAYATFDPDLAEIDPHRAVSMALVHDLAEVEVGDIPRRMAPPEARFGQSQADQSEAGQSEAGQSETRATAENPTKTELESAAIMRLTATDGVSDDSAATVSLHMVHDLWREYESATSASARFVRDMNLIDMTLQAFLYERDGRYEENGSAEAFPDYPRMDEFFETSRSRFSTRLGKQLHGMVERRYRAAVKENQGNVTI